MPIREVIIAVATNSGSSGQAIDCFRLDLGDEASSSSSTTVVDSPHGKFRRTKCTVTLLDGSDASVVVVPSNAKVVAKVYFDGFDHTPTTLEVESIDLPTSSDGVKTKKEWRQAGRLEEKLVVQLGFKMIPDEETEGSPTSSSSSPKWILSHAFVSQPALSD